MSATLSIEKARNSIKKTKKMTKTTKKKVRKMTKELREHLVGARLADVENLNKTNPQGAVRKLLRVAHMYKEVIMSLQQQNENQQLMLDKIADEIVKQEQHLLREVKRLHGLLSTRSATSEASSYIYGQNEIGGNVDSPFSI